MQTLKLFVLATIAASVVATAEKHAAEQVDDVVRTADGTVVGESSLYRFDNRIHAITRTSDLDPGSAVTVWWRIYNRPRFCSVPFACEASDLEAQPQPRKIWPTEIWLREIWLRNLTRKAINVLRVLRRDGWYQVAQRGSHRQFKHPTKPGRVTVPGKPSDDLAVGTLKSILKQAGLEE